MSSGRAKLEHGLKKALGIPRSDPVPDVGGADEEIRSISSADPFIEREPTVGEFLEEIRPTLHDVGHYLYSLFPFLQWLPKYNWIWFFGDLIAGVTVGAVVVPQSMAYAKLANLPVEYGLYSSFMGVLIYWFFATSKDITIGPVAVMSTVTGTVVNHAAETLPDVPGHIVASALAVICGAIICFLGLVRLGWIVEFIPLTAITAFMTGSAISIAAGQVPKLMGIKSVDTKKNPTYRVIIDTLRHLGETKLDAAMGLSALVMLYGIRSLCNFMARKQPHRQKLYFFISTLRTAFVILLYTGISAGVNLHHRSKPKFSILKEVPRGFQHAAVPRVDREIISAFADELPAAVIVLLIEHISISKSFGRVNNYVIQPSQELVAIGVSNLLGPFLGAYPATGSFSRTAIKSKAGVRTPFAGVITALVVLLAIYALTEVFFYIPDASLAAVIIHAVGDVITPPRVVFQFWRVSPIEVPIFFAGVLVTIFSSIENGIYTTIASSFALLIFRLFKAQGRFLGSVRIRTFQPDSKPDGKTPFGDASFSDPQVSVRNAFLPMEHQDGSNPTIHVQNPYPGIFIFCFAEGFNYPNAGHYLDFMTEVIFRSTRRTNPNLIERLGDRPWNDPTPRHTEGLANDTRPTLKAVILDFRSVNNVDVTAVQALIDVRNQLDRHAAPDAVDWHFAHVENRWTRRALAAAGFGYRSLPSTPSTAEHTRGGNQRWRPIFSVADLVLGKGGGSAAAPAVTRKDSRDVEEAGGDDSIVGAPSLGKDEAAEDVVRAAAVPVHGLNRPLFHIDLQGAVDAAIANVQDKTH